MFDLAHDIAIEEERAALLAEAWDRETALERAAEEAERAYWEAILAELDRMAEGGVR